MSITKQETNKQMPEQYAKQQKPLHLAFPIHPRRLDTISQEDSIIPITEKRDKEQQDFIYGSGQGFRRRSKQRYSQGIKIHEDGFESQLKRKVTWIQGNGSAEAFEQISKVFDQSAPKKKISKPKQHQNQQPSLLINKVKTNKSIESKSSISDIEKSQMNTTSNQEICFKLKWIILVVVVIVLAIFSSLSTDVFDLTQGHKGKVKKGKKTGKSHNKAKQVKNKSKKSILT